MSFGLTQLILAGKWVFRREVNSLFLVTGTVSFIGEISVISSLIHLKSIS
jgi:hypothetical protein